MNQTHSLILKNLRPSGGVLTPHEREERTVSCSEIMNLWEFSKCHLGLGRGEQFRLRSDTSF